jgi:copper resistance protein D
MLFLSLVMAPLVRSRRAAPEFMALFRLAARRFRFIVWGAIAVLLSTGPLLVIERGWPLSDPKAWPLALGIKISLVIILLILTLSHDLIFGPQIRKVSALPERERSSWDQALLRSSAWLPRIALLVALSVVAAAVLLARS